jgi:hypothetical protein
MFRRKSIASGPTHGSRTTYKNGCRCARCRAANRDYVAGKRAQERLVRAEHKRLGRETADAQDVGDRGLAGPVVLPGEERIVVHRAAPDYADEVEQFMRRHGQEERRENPFELPSDSEGYHADEEVGPDDARCPRCGEAKRLIFDVYNVGRCGRCGWEGTTTSGRLPAPAPGSPMALRYGEAPAQPRMHTIDVFPGGST